MKIRLHVLLVMVILILSSFMSITTVQGQSTGGEIFLPERIEIDSFISSGTSNDIFFQSNPYNSFLDHSYISSLSTYNLRNYEDDFQSGTTAFNPLTGQATATNPDRIYHASNTSNQLLDLRYTTAYYDMTGGGTIDSINQLILFEDEFFGLRFDAVMNEPLVFDFRIKGESSIELLDIILVSPSDEIFEYSSITNQFETFINHFIPIVPAETGQFELFFSPQNSDLTLDYFHILENPPIDEINTGYSARLVGTETTTQFFQFREFNTSSEANVLDLVGNIFYNDSVASPDQLLGKMDLKYFTSSINSPFGGEFPDVIYQYNESVTFVAVTATPPNDNDAFISGLKSELGLPRGFDIEFSFWGEILETEEFGPDIEFIIDDKVQPNDNHYFWQTNSQQLLSLNHTAGGSAIITNLHDQSEVYTLSSSTNEFLESDAHFPVLLPAGDWMVELTKTGASGIAEVQIVFLQSINLNDPTNFVFNLFEPIVLDLSTDMPIKDRFNFTLLDNLNTSVTVQFDLFDRDLNNIQSGSKLFIHEEGGATFDNFTQFGNTNPVQEFNLNTAYLRLEATSNEIFNPNGSTNATDSEDYSALLQVVRFNYLDEWEDPNNEYVSTLFTGSSSHSLNGSKDNLAYMFYLTTGNTPSGYSLSISAINESYTVYLIADTNNVWRTVTPGATVIDTVTYYNHLMEFATTGASQFAILVFFNGVSLNGSLDLDLNQFVVNPTPNLNLGTMNVVEFPDSRDPNLGDDEAGEGSGIIDFLTKPITLGVIGVAVVATGAFFFLRSRGKFPA